MRSDLVRSAAGKMAAQYNDSTLPMYGDALRLPSRKAIIEIIRSLQKLFFPVYYGEKHLLKLPPEQYGALLMERIFDDLSAQIALTMEDTEEGHRRAEEVTGRLLCKLPDIQRTLQKDLDAFFDGDPAAHDREEIVLSYPGFFAIFIYRIAHELYVMEVPMIPRIMTEYAHAGTGIDINPGATIGEYFFIDHGTGIVVGETSIIGNNVKLYQGATLGALSPAGMRSVPGERRHPKVGNNVTIYAGSTLLGGETEIGDNVIIGGNAFLTGSVEANTTVSIKKPEMRFHEQRRGT
ncbi:MAG: serine acetyltransferase [Ruminococcaceae bacterium]|nr:serine acetyltransferase [Oscillospiraceae bacterium]